MGVHEVVEATNGQQALEILRAQQESDEALGLILSDINMPGMDGFETLTRIRQDETLSRTPVIMCTGSTYDKDMERAEALGAAGYMQKPPSLAQLQPMMGNLGGLQLSREGARAQLARGA